MIILFPLVWIAYPIIAIFGMLGMSALLEKMGLIGKDNPHHVVKFPRLVKALTILLISGFIVMIVYSISSGAFDK
jgi:hypothetical protein